MGKELMHAGYPASELLKCSRYSWCSYKGLRCAGFSVAHLLEGGFSAAELEQLGCTFEEVAKAVPDPSALRQAGFTAAALETAGFSIDDMVAAGYSVRADCFGFVAHSIEYSSLQSMLHTIGERHGSVKRRVENLLLLSPVERRRLFEQATSKSVTGDLRKAESRAHAVRRALEKRQLQKHSSARSKVHKRRQCFSDFSL